VPVIRSDPAPPPTATVAIPDRKSSEAARLAAREAQLKRYAQVVWKHVLRHKPASGRTPGTVTMHFVLSADGALLHSSVAASSGVPALDRLAAEVLRRAQPFPPPPLAAPLAFNIPFEFR
jgi:protein TonB